MGVFLSGKIEPALEGVKITVTSDDAKQEVLSLQTDKRGTYR